MAYNWYPGHMKKAYRAMEEDLKVIDLLIELLDARAPYSTRNPDIDTLGRGKARLILLNKADLADKSMTEEWLNYFKKKSLTVMKLDARSSKDIRPLQAAVEEACKEKRERDRKRGIINRPVRAMVVGIPNVGKSTLINSYAKRAATKTGNKPGVTKGKQWIRLGQGLELLDTPGILWGRIEDEEAGFRLALLGSMNDEILNRQELCIRFIRLMQESHLEALRRAYDITGEMGPLEALNSAALKRNALKKGGLPDTDKAVGFILDDFRSGRLGAITLDRAAEA
ncbi:MAG: ribosome biogenesis GTPase YlqF [Lachnospiraceae bacterium]|nr:ribosome biogenesis GTPase YlqF [Lachnospiraceae bacterium]